MIKYVILMELHFYCAMHYGNRRLILRLQTIFRALIYWAHCEVIIARAQLSCFSFSGPINGYTITMYRSFCAHLYIHYEIVLDVELIEMPSVTQGSNQ